MIAFDNSGCPIEWSHVKCLKQRVFQRKCQSGIVFTVENCHNFLIKGKKVGSCIAVAIILHNVGIYLRILADYSITFFIIKKSLFLIIIPLNNSYMPKITLFKCYN